MGSASWNNLRPTQKRVRTAKGKGKKFERLIADRLALITGGAMKAREMGQAGSDIIDVNGKLLWQYSECKHWDKYPSLNELVDLLHEDKGQQVFFVKADHKPVLVVMELEFFEQILQKLHNTGDIHGSSGR